MIDCCSLGLLVSHKAAHNHVLILSRLKHLNMEKNELYYVPMLKSVEGKVIPNDDEKEKKRLRRSAGRRSAKGSRSQGSRSQMEGDIKEEEGETTVPKPTPVPQSVETEQLASENLSSDKMSSETKTGTSDATEGIIVIFAFVIYIPSTHFRGLNSLVVKHFLVTTATRWFEFWYRHVAG